MEALTQGTTTIDRETNLPSVRAIVAGVAAALVGAAAVLLATGGFDRSTNASESLNAEQIVIRAEVQDRLEALKFTPAFSADRSVVQAEVQDRLAGLAASSGSKADPMVVQAEV